MVAAPTVRQTSHAGSDKTVGNYTVSGGGGGKIIFFTVKLNSNHSVKGKTYNVITGKGRVASGVSASAVQSVMISHFNATYSK